MRELAIPFMGFILKKRILANAWMEER